MVDLRWAFLIALLFLQPSLPYNLSHDALTTGPYLDGIEFVVIDEDLAPSALFNNETDLMGNFLDPEQTMLGSEWIDLPTTPRNGYGYFTINCNKYPLNITAFRRALAFALDKDTICEEGLGGLGILQDSCIPQINPWSYEGSFDDNYYQSNVTMGNILLDQAGFNDINDDDVREAPDGSALSVDLATYESSEIGQFVCQQAIIALEALGINSSIILDAGAYNINDRLYFHLDYDIIFTSTSFPDFNIDWFAYEYWSEYIDEPYYNYPNFQNVSYDTWRETLLYMDFYPSVQAAAVEMQKIIQYECPIIVCYENLLISAHRTDRFEGWMNVPSRGIPNWWNYFGVHLRTNTDISNGGTLRVSINGDVQSFNIMMLGNSRGSTYGNGEYKILRLLYDSLLMLAPNNTLIPWLADSYSTHSVGGFRGEMSITLEINSNAKWSDGSLLTAEDAAYSLNFYKEADEHPFGSNLGNMVNASVDNFGRLIIEYNEISYWNLQSLASVPILPKVLLSELNPEEWMLWNPNPLVDEMLTSGPFIISDYEVNNHISLVANPFYYRKINEPVNSTTTWEISWLTGPVLTLSAAAVIIVSFFALKRYEKKE